VAADPENLRAEYQALSAYFNIITTIRFTILGALLAAVALISGHGVTRLDGVGIAIAGAMLWQMELRSRALSRNMATRAVEIERSGWDLGVLEGFYSRQWKFDVENPTWDTATLFGRPLRLRGRVVKVSYSLSFDVLFAVATAYGLYRIARP
jgi:hypothetical protein